MSIEKLLFFLIIFLMLLGGLFGIFCKSVSRWSKFRKRPDIDFEEIYLSYFAQRKLPKNLTENVWLKISKELGISPKKLRVNDRFGNELITYCGVDVDEGLNNILLEYNNGSFPQNVGIINTIGDFVVVIVELKQRQM